MKQVTGSDLRAMRQYSGLTTLQMAHAAGVKTRKTYENWEKNVGTPSVNQFFLLIQACGFDMNTFLQFLELRSSQNAQKSKKAA